MLNKRKCIFYGIIVLSLLLLSIGIINLFLKVKNNSNLKSNIKNEIKLNMDDDFCEIIRQVAKKNGDWKKLPISKKFKKKYDSKEGILKGDNFTYLSWSTDYNDKEKQIACLIVKHNLKNEHYYIHYTLNNKNELDDVEIVEKKLIYDEYGNEVDDGTEEFKPSAMIPTAFEDFVKQFCFIPNDYNDYEQRLWEWILFSDKFMKKTFDSPFGIEYDDNPVRKVKILDGTSYDDKVAYVEIDNEIKKERFKIIFEFTDDGIVDDFIVEKL